MSARNDGGPAFPITDSQTVHRIGAAACEGITDPTEKDKVYLAAAVAAAGGMSLRDHFATHAPVVPDWFKHEATTTRPVLPDIPQHFTEAQLEHLTLLIAEKAPHAFNRNCQVGKFYASCEAARTAINAWRDQQREMKFFAWRWYYADAMIAERAK